MWIGDLGRAFQRISAFLFLAALIGLPLAVILPDQSGLVLILALALGAVVRVARHRPAR